MNYKCMMIMKIKWMDEMRSNIIRDAVKQRWLLEVMKDRKFSWSMTWVPKHCDNTNTPLP